MAEWLTKQSEVVCPSHDTLMEWMGHEPSGGTGNGELRIFFRCPGFDDGDVGAPSHDTELVFMIEGQQVRAGVRERESADVRVLTDEEMAALDGDPAATEGGSPPSGDAEFETELTKEQVDPTQGGDG